MHSSLADWFKNALKGNLLMESKTRPRTRAINTGPWQKARNLILSFEPRVFEPGTYEFPFAAL